MKYWVESVILLLLVSSCSFSEKGKLKQLEEKVLHQHDEAMSQMDNMNKLQRKLQAYLIEADTNQIQVKQLQKENAD